MAVVKNWVGSAGDMLIPLTSNASLNDSKLISTTGQIFIPSIPPPAIPSAKELINTALYNDASLLAYYRMEGNSNDEKETFDGSDANMTYASTTPKYTQYAIFNGTSSKIDLGTNANLSPAAITVACWVYCANFTTIQSVFMRAAGAWSSYYTFNISTSGRLRSYCTGSAGGFVLDGATGVVLSTSAWQHIAWTYNSTNGLITYVNGSPDQTVAAGGTMNTGSANTWIGWEVDNNRWFGSGANGYIDDLCVFSRALTGEEIATLAP